MKKIILISFILCLKIDSLSAMANPQIRLLISKSAPLLVQSRFFHKTKLLSHNDAFLSPYALESKRRKEKEEIRTTLKESAIADSEENKQKVEEAYKKITIIVETQKYNFSYKTYSNLSFKIQESLIHAKLEIALKLSEKLDTIDKEDIKLKK